MSTSDQVNAKFSEFGKMLYISGILYIIDIFFYIVGYFGYIVGIAILILMIIGLKNIKDANLTLNNPFLSGFYSRLLSSQIFFVIGGFFIEGRNRPALIVGLIIEIVGFVLAYFAWDKFMIFAQKMNFNSSINPLIYKRAGNLKTANLLLALFFLVITAIIGIVYMIIGYIGLGKVLKSLNFLDVSQPTSEYEHQKYPSPAENIKNYSDFNEITTSPSYDTAINTVPKSKFCTTCGASLKENAKFCTKCGSPISKSNSYE